MRAKRKKALRKKSTQKKGRFIAGMTATAIAPPFAASRYHWNWNVICKVWLTAMASIPLALLSFGFALAGLENWYGLGAIGYVIYGWFSLVWLSVLIFAIGVIWNGPDKIFCKQHAKMREGKR